ncbi:MAG: ABC transporter permease [Myxococcota bacterium]
MPPTPPRGGGAGRRLGRRLAWALVVVMGVVTVSFAIQRTLPGDAVRMLLGPQADAADVARARRIYALDAPLWTQYLRFWKRLVHLAPAPEPGRPSATEGHRTCGRPGLGLHVDLGYSHRYRQPVTALIARKAPATFELAVGALGLQAVLGLGLGVAAARTRRSSTDQVIVGATLVSSSAPIFALGLLLQYLLAYRLGWLPFDGAGDASSRGRHLLLPTLTLGLYGAALYTRLTREEMIDTLGSDYVLAARARGASTWRATVVHGLRTALLPIVTLLVLELGALLGGAVVTEKLFRWPGLGALAVDAMVHRDGAVIMGTVLFGAVTIVIATLIVELLALLLDPRLRR